MGIRRTERSFKDELPVDELKLRLNNVREKIAQNTPDNEVLKILMITHKVLAAQQGYEQLLDILDDGLRNKEDPFLISLLIQLNRYIMHLILRIPSCFLIRLASNGIRLQKI